MVHVPAVVLATLALYRLTGLWHYYLLWQNAGDFDPLDPLTVFAFVAVQLATAIGLLQHWTWAMYLAFLVAASYVLWACAIYLTIATDQSLRVDADMLELSLTTGAVVLVAALCSYLVYRQYGREGV